MNKLPTKKNYLLVEKEIIKFGKCTQTLDYEFSAHKPIIKYIHDLKNDFVRRQLDH